MRLTADAIRAAPVYLNPLKQREINLRGLKLPAIENLGVTNNEYEVLDLSDNEIVALENFPLLTRMDTILLSNNRIHKIAKYLNKAIPNISTLLLNNNRLTSFSDIDPLVDLSKSLTHLSLLGNPVAKVEHYRLYVIHLLPNLKVLDFNKVKPKERESALARFGPSPTSSDRLSKEEDTEMESKQSTERVPLGIAAPEQTVSLGPSPAMLFASKTQKDSLPVVDQEKLLQEQQRLLAAIDNASTMEEIQALEKQLAVITQQQQQQQQ